MAAAAGEIDTAVDAPATVSAIGATPDDATLMLRYRKGDVRAFEMLYQRHKGALYRYLQRLCRSQDVANDLFQEVWSKVIASRERYEARAKFLEEAAARAPTYLVCLRILVFGCSVAANLHGCGLAPADGEACLASSGPRAKSTKDAAYRVTD